MGLRASHAGTAGKRRGKTRLKPRKRPAFFAPVGAKDFEFVLREAVDPKTLGAALRRLRESCNLTAGQLAERMGWTSQNVLRLERGGGGAAEGRKREPTLSSVNLYVRMLGFELVLAGRPMTPQRSPRRRRVEGEEAESEETAVEGSGESE